jgi:hypothetical protein
VNLEQVVGSFVVEIGFRQAWPFLGLCDNRPTPAQEARLYIDASWAIEGATSTSGSANDDIAWLTAAIPVNGRIIETVQVSDDGSLTLTTDIGITMVISGEVGPDTIGEPWRLTGWQQV